MNRLRELRREKGLTQVQMAEIFNMPQGAYSNYELEKIGMGKERSAEFANFFHVSVDYLKCRSNLRSFPIIGIVAAGKGSWAEEEVEGYENFNHPEGTNGADFYVLRVRGKSMFPYYLPNDYILCQKGEFEIEKNAKYIVLIGQEATVKMVEKVRGGIKLVAYNKDVFPDKVYTKDECASIPVKIIARVRQLHRDE